MNLISTEVLFGPAPINWCEAPSHGVKEVVNSVTSLAYILSAVAVVTTPTDATNKLYKHLYAWALALTGLTSALFHAELVYWQQKADESFETLSVIVLLHWAFTASVQNIPDKAMASKQGFSALVSPMLHWLIVLPVVWLVPAVATELHLLIVALIAAYELGRVVDRASDPTAVLLHRVAVYASLGGFGLWMVDFLGCEPIVQKMIIPALGFNPELHGFWHLFTAIGLACAGLCEIRMAMAKYKQ